MAATAVLLHGFGVRYDLPASLAIYLFAAGGVVVVSFVLVVLFAGDQVGAEAIQYPRRALPFLLPIARSPWPRIIGGLIGVLGLTLIIITGLFGSPDATRNPAEYLTWIYFWAATVIVSGLVGNLWYLLNPWAAIYDVMKRLGLPSPPLRGGAPHWVGSLGIWPAGAAYLGFACLELTTGMANRPWILGTLAAVYTAVTLAGMILYGREAWLEHCEAFTVLFSIVGRFGPVEAARDDGGIITAVYIRPWGVGMLQPSPTGWDRVVFVILMLSTLAFDGIEVTPAWQNFSVALEPLWQPYGAFGFFVFKTVGLLLVTAAFLLIFIAFMEMVIYFGNRKVDLKATATAFALTLVPIALVYNAAHNYNYVMVQSQALIPLLDDPLAKGWHLLPAVVGYKPSFALAQASTVWFAQIILIVIGHVIAVYLSHLKAGERFRTAQRALLSQYPMLLLMVMYTMTSLWILAQPITAGG
ncbi:MAG: hypothetical protein AUH40_07570 [Chloroflexi bacterium 13_1_40CM_65_17]|nr:MAG: hypothetical protein AUH40_07570 [Chloroflexi bacterium 13_1_40CM_65_17]